MITSIDTAIENMIQSHIDEQDFVCRLDAEQYTDGEVNDMRADMESELTELQHRIEALEEKAESAAVDPEPRAEEPEPRAVNQIDWIMTPNDMIAGYETMQMLEQYVLATVHHGERSQESSQANANMLIMMTLATARNLINKKLEAET